jgi:hypothetical protein
VNKLGRVEQSGSNLQLRLISRRIEHNRRGARFASLQSGGDGVHFAAGWNAA